MNKIVVAIDFSESSMNAFRHALSIAQKCKTDLDLGLGAKILLKKKINLKQGETRQKKSKHSLRN